MGFKKDQLIDQNTIAVQYYFSDKYQSKIVKKDGIYYSEKSPIQLMNEACLAYGSTLQGREQAVSKNFNIYKSPFIVSPFDICFFPTSSRSNLDCTWIGFHPFELIKLQKKLSRFVFYNSITVDVKASAYTIRQQNYKMHMIINYFRNKKKGKF